MAGDFDPYYKWLGIQPKDHPPHYYRLLGIELFEADPEVIAIAAEQRMRHVRSFQTGEYVLVSQKMQKKIAAAKACLLNPDKKTEYDISLRLQLRLQPAQSLPLPPPPQKYPASPQAAPLVPLLQDYLQPPPVVKTAPVQTSNTDFNINPIVVVKESVDFLRSHKWVVSVSIKLGCAAIVVVIMLMVFAHGKALWTFTFDKTSNLIAKIPGSSEEKPPERLTRMRSNPRVKPENSANNTENQPSGIPPPVDMEEKSVMGENSSAANTVAPPPAAENNQASPPTAEIISLKLPSGKNFKSRLFKVNVFSIVDLVKDPAKDEPVLYLFHPGGHISALASHDKGVLNGICMAFYEYFQPMTYAVYTDGSLDGMIKTWNTKGERVYWCQYEKGIRHGFCCYFKDNYLRMLLEIDSDTISGVHLCVNGELDKSFSSVEQASADKDAQKLLDEIDEVESELKINETAFKKQVKSEFQYLRREKTGFLTAQKRAIIQDRINLRISESPELIKYLRNFSGL